MLKILQARIQQYLNRELPDVQAGFRKGRGTRDQIANIRCIMEKAREFQKNIYLFWEILKIEGEGAAEDEIVSSITDSMDMNLSKFWETVKHREAWHAAVHGVTKSQNWTTTI